MSLDLTILTFDHADGAERAFTHLPESVLDEPWLAEVAFVERRRRGRIVVRGTFAGRYLDVEDESDVLGRDTLVGALTGAVIGAAFGPPGFAAGLVAGGAIGGVLEASHIPALEGALFDEIRVRVPAGSSAIVLLAQAPHADAMVAAFAPAGGRVFRRSLSADAAKALESAVAAAPLAASAD